MKKFKTLSEISNFLLQSGALRFVVSGKTLSLYIGTFVNTELYSRINYKFLKLKHDEDNVVIVME